MDAVDRADRTIGSVPRAAVFERRSGFRVVHVLVMRATDELLVQQLGRGRDRNPLRWGSSVAGYLHRGEDYARGAERRLREELGLTTPLEKYGETWMDDQGARKFIGVFTTASDHASIGEPDHIEALRWAKLDELDAEMTSSPDNFTETFRHVFRFYMATKDLPRT